MRPPSWLWPLRTGDDAAKARKTFYDGSPDMERDILRSSVFDCAELKQPGKGDGTMMMTFADIFDLKVAEGRLEGKAEGRRESKVEGRLGLMHSLVSERFGDDVARDAFPALSGMVKPADLHVANGLLYECPSRDEFLERLAQLGRTNGSAD